MDKKTKWSAATVVALIAGAANAGDRGQFQITPYLGHASVKVDGQYLERGSSESYTQWLVGISAGYRAPFGLVVEIGDGRCRRADLRLGGRPARYAKAMAPWAMTSSSAGAGTSPRNLA